MIFGRSGWFGVGLVTLTPIFAPILGFGGSRYTTLANAPQPAAECSASARLACTARSRPADLLSALDDQAEADVLGRGVDRLALTRRRPVAQAVVGRAQV